MEALRGAAAGVSLVCVLAVLVAGCGSSGTSTTLATRPETPQPLPKLPPGWKADTNRSIGYAIGLPPGWKARDVHGQVTLIRSPDHLVSVRLTADRTPEALGVPVKSFAAQALASLPGYKDQPVERPRRVAALSGPLEVAEANADVVASVTGINTGLRVLVLRRPRVVNYTAVVAANAEQAPAWEGALALHMLKTLRDRPVTNAPPAGSL
jgi:hypothetical protein